MNEITGGKPIKIKVDYVELHLPMEYGPQGNLGHIKTEEVMPTLLKKREEFEGIDKKRFEEEIIRPLDQNFQQVLRDYKSIYPEKD